MSRLSTALDLILAGVLMEALVLGVWAMRRRPGLVAALLTNLTAGAALLLALRAELSGHEPLVWAALALALAAHLLDLRLRVVPR